MSESGLTVYLVGGAVRDQLLDRPVCDRDWVVVGATTEQMIEAGYRPVGKDFPVFLHPETHEEYALARTERKSGRGYGGFQVHAAPDVTLEDDLLRRDLTINAIAMDADGSLIDPHGGLEDIRQRRLRHVSAAFVEDPLRVLRVARFAARYHHLGFTVAEQTMTLMRQCVDEDEMEQLVAERVFTELSAALGEKDPQVFLQVLRRCGALARLLPEVDILYGIEQDAHWHPEIDTGIHLEMVLKQSALMDLPLPARFAALLHDLGKGLTDPSDLPHHPGHEAAGVPLVRAVCQRLKAPKKMQQLAEQVCAHHLSVHTAFDLDAEQILQLIQATDAQRKPEQFEMFLLACEADSRGRPVFEDQAYPQRPYLSEAARAVRDCDLSEALALKDDHPAMLAAMTRLRLAAIRQVMARFTATRD